LGHLLKPWVQIALYYASFLQKNLKTLIVLPVSSSLVIMHLVSIKLFLIRNNFYIYSPKIFKIKEMVNLQLNYHLIIIIIIL